MATVEEVNREPRKVPFVTDRERTATDILLITAHNLASALTNLTNTFGVLATRVSQEENDRIAKVFAVKLEIPREAEWQKPEDFGKDKRPSAEPIKETPPETEQK